MRGMVVAALVVVDVRLYRGWWIEERVVVGGENRSASGGGDKVKSRDVGTIGVLPPQQMAFPGFTCQKWPAKIA